MIAKERSSMELLAWQAGRGDALAANEVCRRMRGLIHKTARKLANSVTPLEDLEQVGQIGVLQAIANFDPSRRVRFVNFAMLRVHGAMVDYLRDHGSLIHVPRYVYATGTFPKTLPLPSVTDDEGQTAEWDFPAGPSEAELMREHAERWETLRPYLRYLRPREQRLVIAYYAEDIPQAQIAAELGICPSYVSILLKQIHQHLAPGEADA